jgi:hypothetical protein
LFAPLAFVHCENQNLSDVRVVDTFSQRPMFDPSGLTIGQVSSTVRDFSIVIAIFTGGLTIAWKGRGWFELAKGFFERCTRHMDTMERGMQTLLSNHLYHIETDLKSIASHQVRASERQVVQYAQADEIAVDLDRMEI